MKFTKFELEFILVVLGEMSINRDKEIYKILDINCYEWSKEDVEKIKNINSEDLYFKVSKHLGLE